MKNNVMPLSIVLFVLTIFSVTGCRKEPVSNETTIIVETEQIRDITSTSALGGGNVSTTVVECGVCWAEHTNPSIVDEHIVSDITSGSFVCTITGLDQGSTYYVRAYAISSDAGISYGEIVKFVTSLAHEYVDLGLPSGTLWATCNVGAEEPEDYGLYFPWAEKIPSAGLGRYMTYKHFDEGIFYYAKKYCNNPDCGLDGYTDNLIELERSDDAATLYYGKGWRTPSYDEWEELVENCERTYTTLNDVVGILFTSVNGNSIFLPAAGVDEFGQSSSPYGAGWLCSYYSSRLFTDNPITAWGFSNANSEPSNGKLKAVDRIYGHSIRPVHSALSD